ncbi:MAG: phenylalanine--tRNA ligase subunit alpha [Oligoflexia bacterium]|nr:phenylalanine--tRNA ligase subunit alpha [Oligoflexia bacterium]
MKERLKDLEKGLIGELALVDNKKDLESFKVKALGRKSELQQIMKSIGSLGPEEKRETGILVNGLKSGLQKKIDDLESRLNEQEKQRSISAESVDVSLPGRHIRLGALHPVTIVLDRVRDIFRPLGYDVVTGPEIEHDFYNFEALNIPPEHPARDMQDTFYIHDSVVLRTHTSPIQIRTMLKAKPPVRILAPGRVYRSDYDISHTPMFHQVEGLFVDRGVRFSDLKGTLLYFARNMFGEETNIRLRPSYFPFTEPSAEVDVTCVMCRGKGCRLCKDTGWIEILGCGMVHPNVFGHVGYPDDITGFAFGMGIERIAMLKYRISDLRMFFENDVRFLEQFI